MKDMNVYGTIQHLLYLFVISVSNLIHPIFVVEEMSEDHQNQYVSSYGDHGSQFKMSRQ